MLGTRCWILDTRYWLLVARRSALLGEPFPLFCLCAFSLPCVAKGEAWVPAFLLSLLPFAFTFCISGNSIIHLSYGNILFNSDLSANFVFRDYPYTAV